MDKERAIASFLANLGTISRLPLITDSEMEGLYGKDVAAALSEMAQYDRQHQVCARCERRCCPAISCEFYAPQFGRCPIHDLRPVVCRLHYCTRFPLANSPLMKELDDIFFDSLLIADRAGNPRAGLFDCPPIGRIAPELVAPAIPLVKAVNEGCLDPKKGEKLIHRHAEEYRAIERQGRV